MEKRDGHILFGDKIIALDKAKRIVQLSEIKSGTTDFKFIDLAKISAVTLRKSYGSIRSGQLKKKAIEDFLTKIELRFQYLDGKETYVFTMFDRETDDETDLRKSARRAKDWHLLLSRLIGPWKDT